MNLILIKSKFRKQTIVTPFVKLNNKKDRFLEKVKNSNYYH